MVMTMWCGFHLPSPWAGQGCTHGELAARVELQPALQVISNPHRLTALGEELPANGNAATGGLDAGDVGSENAADAGGGGDELPSIGAAHKVVGREADQDAVIAGATMPTAAIVSQMDNHAVMVDSGFTWGSLNWAGLA